MTKTDCLLRLGGRFHLEAPHSFTGVSIVAKTSPYGIQDAS